jgi:hypothetical protein
MQGLDQDPVRPLVEREGGDRTAAGRRGPVMIAQRRSARAGS